MGLFSRSRNAAEQRIWDVVYRASLNEYTFIEGYDDEDARKTANAAMRSWYTPKGRVRAMKGIRRCPDPGNVLNIGTFLGIDSVRRNGDFVYDAFDYEDAVPLLWSHDMQACFVFPKLRAGACNKLPTPREDRLSRVWAKGRPARCSADINFPDPPLPIVRPGLAIAYDSDKFTRGRRQEYVHHFGPEVRCYTSRDSTGSPRAIMVRGGKLRLTTHGLAG